MGGLYDRGCAERHCAPINKRLMRSDRQLLETLFFSFLVWLAGIENKDGWYKGTRAPLFKKKTPTRWWYDVATIQTVRCLFFLFLSLQFLFIFVLFFFVLWLIDPTASGSLRTGQEEWKIRRASLLVDVHHLEFIFSILGDRTCLELAHTAVTSSTFTGYNFHCITSNIYTETCFTFELFLPKNERI
jgi:hypothetical protein